jgi:peptide/nickel transport system ATP-binding protein
MMDPGQLVDVCNLTVDFLAGRAPLRAVAGLDLMLRAGEVLALLAESGSGKTVTLRALMRLLPVKRAAIGGQIVVDGRDVLALPRRELSDYRGRTVAMVFQEPGLALDPVYRVGDQIAEAVTHDAGGSWRAGRAPPWSCSSAFASPPSRSGSTLIRMSFPAACASSP